MHDDPQALGRALEAAVAAAHSAAEAILPLFRSEALDVESKGDGSPVTQADRAAEAVVRRHLAQAYPDIDILGEEEGFEDRGSRLRWIIDPIDGTISFSRGLPLFGTLIALEDRQEDRGLLGVIHLPALGETYSGGRGLGVHCGGEALRIGPHSPGASAPLIAAGDPLQFQLSDCAADCERLARKPFFRGYTDCFGHAMVLRGGVAAMVDPGLALWDIAATRVLVEEAGGQVFCRPSTQEGKVDAILGQRGLVEELVEELGWA